MKNQTRSAKSGSCSSEPFSRSIGKLSAYHRKNCTPYSAVCEGLGEDTPLLPVDLFKDVRLISTRPENVYLQLTSSGTGGQKPSRIYLDEETSAAQRSALVSILSDYVGSKRRPMLIIDREDLLQDRRSFSSRATAVLGFSVLSTHRYFALDSDMRLNIGAIRDFLRDAAGGPALLFGFTFVVWKYFAQALKDMPDKPDFSSCILIHGGGWKKMQNIAVSPDTFRRELCRICSLKKENIHNYYGMVEQPGSIFMECGAGHLHSSRYSDVRVLNPEDFSECRPGEPGILALYSLLPRSYPGHALLSSDIGMYEPADGTPCSCGRPGRSFTVSGRIRQAEIRGCSDTRSDPDPADHPAHSDPSGRHMDAASSVHPTAASAPDASSAIDVLAGNWRPVRYAPMAPFSDLAMHFLSCLSRKLMTESDIRKHPDAMAFAFWCRPSALRAMEERYRFSDSVRGRGLAFHLAPSNMPAMFAYSFAVSLLAGNPNIVRLSGRISSETEYLLSEIRSCLDREEFQTLKQSNAFVRFPHDTGILSDIFASCSSRILWGSRATVEKIAALPAPGCTDLLFPSRYSFSVFRTEYLRQLSAEDLDLLVSLFYRDTYEADQNACASPGMVFWLDGDLTDKQAEKAKQRFWNRLAFLASGYASDPWRAVEKYTRLCRSYIHASESHYQLLPVRRWKNDLYVVPVRELPAHLHDLDGKFGTFYEKDVRSLKELLPWIEPDIQTVTYAGIDPEKFRRLLDEHSCTGVRRLVPAGEALRFDPVWDGIDMIRMLTDA
ncbi:MAG: acyl-CoA reductase [Bilifractor sp.]|jgi:hypothetical protein